MSQKNMDLLFDAIYTHCFISCNKCYAELEEDGTTEDAFAERCHNKGWVVKGKDNTVLCPVCSGKRIKPQQKKKK